MIIDMFINTKGNTWMIYLYTTTFIFCSFFFILVNVGDDSPVFEGLFEYCGLSAGGSMGKKEKKWKRL